MDIELLVTQLAQSILKELQAEKRQTIVLFAERDRKLPEGLAELLGPESRVLHVSDPYHSERVDRYILPCLYIDQMVDLALGKGGSKLMYAVRQVLLTGKTVEVFQWEYEKYMHSAPRAMLDLYAAYRKELGGFGLTNCAQKATPVRFGKKVLTEADILWAQEHGSIQLDVAASCRITPLARETARNLGIRISTDTGGIA